MPPVVQVNGPTGRDGASVGARQIARLEALAAWVLVSFAGMTLSGFAPVSIAVWYAHLFVFLTTLSYTVTCMLIGE